MRVRSILMTADTAGGVWTYSIELARALAAHGIEVLLASMGAPLSGPQREDVLESPNVRVFESGYRLEWMQDPWDDVRRAGDWLLELQAAHRPDVIHLNGYAHGALNWKAPVLITAHSCVLSWWRAVKQEEAPPEWDAYRRAVRAGLDGASAVVAPSAAMLRALAQHYGPLPAAQIIPNSRRPDLFAPARKEPYLFAAGRLWDEAKNIQALDAIADRVAWPVCVAGDCEHPSGRKYVPGRLNFLGKLSLDAMVNHYSRASIFVSPARYEPFGLAILEAALSGCALILGDIPSLRENWEGAAVFVHPEDTEELRRTIDLLIDRPHLRGALSAGAVERARRFDPGMMARTYLDVYTKLVARVLLSCA